MTRFLILPGWRDSGPGHWQSRWPALHGLQAHFRKVDQDDWDWPKRGDWMMRLDEALLSEGAHPSTAPVILMAHSLGCHLVAAWAAHSRHTRLVHGAWLVTPPDLDGPPTVASMAPQLQSWRQVHRQPLPFPTMVLGSRNDPFASFQRTAALATDWGADLTDLGEAGHVNAESGHGDWADGWEHLTRTIPSWHSP